MVRAVGLAVFSLILVIAVERTLGVRYKKYKPGTPGKVWDKEEIKIAREKIIRMLDAKEYDEDGAFMQKVDGKRKFTRNQDKEFLTLIGTKKIRFREGSDEDWINRPITSRVLRLAFHDCIASWKEDDEKKKFGCDGCLHWDEKEMNARFERNGEADDFKARDFAGFVGGFDQGIPPKGGTNNGLATIVKALEYVYQETSWPPGAASLEPSLKDRGASRADLWQFAANIALELEIEKANYACKYDKTNQQASILEGEDKCMIKLHKPIVFKFGRKDCGATYKTTNKETVFNPHGTSKPILDDLHSDFGFSDHESIALMAAHSTQPNVPNIRENLRYGWIGNYLSNMYFKYLAMEPTYLTSKGLYQRTNDLVLHGKSEKEDDGVLHGKPVDGRRWKIQCFNRWNKANEDDKYTGPCVFKPTLEGCKSRIFEGALGKCMETNVLHAQDDDIECEVQLRLPNKAEDKNVLDICPIGYIGNVPKVRLCCNLYLFIITKKLLYFNKNF